MPIYEVTQEGTGITLELEGERPPKKEDVERAFAFAGAQKYANAPTYGLGGSVLQAPPSLYEQAKSVAPSVARVAAPIAFGRPTPQDVATTGRVIQQGAEAVRRLTGGREKPEELLQGASQIEREGILALGSASPEKRELAASLGGRLGEVVSEYTPIPESVTRPVGQVTGQVAADLLSPMNLMSLGIAGAARQASRIPQLVAGAEFAETTAPSAVRAAQIADLTRASEAAAATEQAGRLVAPALLPPITLGAAESTGIALQTVADPNATPEQKLKASLEAGVGMLFSAGLGAQVGKTFGMKRGVTQAEVLEQLASRKQTVGEAVGKVEGLLDEMDRIVPVKNLREEFRKAIAALNPDDPFIFQPETIGEGPRAQVEGGMLPPREAVEPERPSTLRTQDEILQASLRARDERIAAEQQQALEREAVRAGTPLRTAEEAQAEMAARRQRVREQAALIREGLRRELTPEEVMIEQEAQARPSARQIAEELRRQIEPRIEAPEVLTEPRPVREGGLLPQREVVVEEPVQERAPVFSVEDVLAERLRARDERIANETQKALEAESAKAGTPLRTAQETQAQRSAERQAFRQRAAAIREAIGRRGFTTEELIRGEPVPEVQEQPVRDVQLVTPELTVERPTPRRGGMLPPREVEISPTPEGTVLRSAEDIMAERLRARDERVAAEQQRIAAEQARVPLETASEKLARALESRDRRLAAEAAAEALESGAARGESVRVTRATVEKLLGMKEKTAGQAVAEETIFNEVWNKAVEETKGKFRQKAETVAQRLEGLRAEVEPGVGANPFPQLMGAAWNGALSVAQAVIRAGGTVADGVAAGIRYAKQNFKDKFDEAEFSSQLRRVIERPSQVQVPEGMRARRFAERAAASPGIPPVIREAIAASPEASYVRQNFRQVEQEAGVKTVNELYADISNPESNTSTASSVELIKRQIAAGEAQDVVDNTLKLAKRGTTMGQLINQMKLLKSGTREGIIYLVTKSMADNGRTPDGPQLKKLGDLMDSYIASKSNLEKAGLKLKEAGDTGDVNAYNNAINEFNVAEDVLRSSDVDLVTQIGRMNPSSISDLYLAMVQGSVQSTMSLAGNLVGSVINRPFGLLADILANRVDSLVFKGRLGNTFDLRARTLDRINSLKRSIPEGFRTLWRGSEASPYEAGGDIATPLNFTRAARNVYDRIFNDAKDVPLLRNAIEASIGAYPDMIFRINQSVDNVFRSADRIRLIREIGKKRGLTDRQIQIAQRDPNLYLISDAAFEKGAKGFTANDLGLIDFESARGVYQQENVATRAFSGFNRYLRQNAGPEWYTFSRLLNLFQKTPINVAAEVASYTPAGLLRTRKMWADMSPRERNLVASKMLVGAMALGAYNVLYDKGIITADLDTPGETNKARELAKSGGVMPPGTLNKSGLFRYLKGEDPRFRAGDEVKDLGKLGVSGALGKMVATARRLQERSRTDTPDWLTVGAGIVFSGANFVMQQGFLDGINGFIKSLSEESGSALERLAKKFLSTATSPLHPAILGNLMRAEREFVPVTGGENVIKDFTNELNQKYGALPFVEGKQLPLRRDLWGQAVRQTPKSENPWTYNFFEPWKSREIDADPLNASIYRVWRRTADNRAIPSIPNPQITYGKTTFEKLTPDQFDRYAQLVGFYRRKSAEQVYMTREYQEAPDDLRITMLNRAYDRGINIGKYRFIQELAKTGQTLTPVAPRRGFEE